MEVVNRTNQPVVVTRSLILLRLPIFSNRVHQLHQPVVCPDELRNVVGNELAAHVLLPVLRPVRCGNSHGIEQLLVRPYPRRQLTQLLDVINERESRLPVQRLLPVRVPNLAVLLHRVHREPLYAQPVAADLLHLLFLIRVARGGELAVPWPLVARVAYRHAPVRRPCRQTLDLLRELANIHVALLEQRQRRVMVHLRARLGVVHNPLYLINVGGEIQQREHAVPGVRRLRDVVVPLQHQTGREDLEEQIALVVLGPEPRPARDDAVEETPRGGVVVGVQPLQQEVPPRRLALLDLLPHPAGRLLDGQQEVVREHGRAAHDGHVRGDGEFLEDPQPLPVAPPTERVVRLLHPLEVLLVVVQHLQAVPVAERAAYSGQVVRVKVSSAQSRGESAAGAGGRRTRRIWRRSTPRAS
ncbi:unnamed protein product [Clonostachys solani]|uniref:Uncharacterized protein n=1 Tax=Clonostachys solani TaxID=160281 RepID=A0A9P0EAI0_9HYPO|nr:unnamed protein product [Clonostachys solani]